ncbi:MAG: hypothetical protein QFB86_04565 [Patescibacteria group bacterium]|nr:hypothetical protein [Patescibacteria group bacterium]
MKTHDPYPDEAALLQAARDVWNANRDEQRGVDPEVLAEIGYATKEHLPEVIASTVERIETNSARAGSKKRIGGAAIQGAIAASKGLPPKQRRGRNKDGSIDRRTLSPREQRIADNEAPKHIRDQMR